MSPEHQPPNRDVLIAAAVAGGSVGLIVGYCLAVDTDDIAPDAIMWYDADEEPAWSYE